MVFLSVGLVLITTLVRRFLTPALVLSSSMLRPCSPLAVSDL
jgi:hypothetical protein